MNSAQEAALGPLYADFKSVYGHTSGVALGVALAYGIDVDAFSRIDTPCEIEGELVLKIWTVRSSKKMLWCYIAADNGANVCFALFQPSSNRGDANAQVIMASPLGTSIRAEFSTNSRGKTRCDDVAQSIPDHVINPL
ncbi:MAG: hypothetical protein IJ111_07190 [Eggerthellaceae bacterium]|nr:hypothetical protein [Eggerthellaceae bacterium]